MVNLDGSMVVVDIAIHTPEVIELPVKELKIKLRLKVEL